MDKRTVWIDNLKAIMIFYVILGHNDINATIVKYIFSFHMPMFFFISGYLFNFEKYGNFTNFVQRKFSTIMVPYFAFSIIIHIYWYLIVRNLSIRGNALTVEPITSLLKIFYYGKGSYMGGVLWFLPCLFFVQIIFWWILKYMKCYKYIIIIIVLSAASGYIISILMPYPHQLPWSIDIALTGLVFYGTGYCLKEIINTIVKNWNVKSYITLLILMFASILFCYINGRVDLAINFYDNILFFYISSFSGIFFYLGLCTRIKRNIIMEFISKNTIILFALHGQSLFVIRGIYYVVLKELPELSNISLAGGIILTTLQIILLMPIIYLINNYFPFMIGIIKKHN